MSNTGVAGFWGSVQSGDTLQSLVPRERWDGDANYSTEAEAGLSYARFGAFLQVVLSSSHNSSSSSLALFSAFSCDVHVFNPQLRAGPAPLPASAGGKSSMNGHSRGDGSKSISTSTRNRRQRESSQQGPELHDASLCRVAGNEALGWGSLHDISRPR